MTDLLLAKKSLPGHTLALCKDGKILLSDARGIAPMLDFIGSGVDLKGYSAADLVVGKAAAMLFVKAGVKAVFAKTLSHGGKAVLESCGVKYGYGVLTEKIINRDGTDICPMEKAVAFTDDVEEGYILIKAKREELSARPQK